MHPIVTGPITVGRSWPRRRLGRLLCLMAMAELLASTTGIGVRAQSGDFAPLREGLEWVYDFQSDSTMSVPDRPPISQSQRGRMIVRVDGREATGGRQYWRLAGRYEGIPDLEALGTFTWYERSAADGLYHAGQKLGPGLKENLLLAVPSDVGRTWPYDDGTGRPARMRIASRVAVETPARRFDTCLQVVQEFLEPQHRAECVDETYYCDGVGKVKTVQKHIKQDPSRIVETTRVLISARSAKD